MNIKLFSLKLSRLANSFPFLKILLKRLYYFLGSIAGVMMAKCSITSYFSSPGKSGYYSINVFHNGFLLHGVSKPESYELLLNNKKLLIEKNFSYQFGLCARFNDAGLVQFTRFVDSEGEYRTFVLEDGKEIFLGKGMLGWASRGTLLFQPGLLNKFDPDYSFSSLEQDIMEISLYLDESKKRVLSDSRLRKLWPGEKFCINHLLYHEGKNSVVFMLRNQVNGVKKSQIFQWNIDDDTIHALTGAGIISHFNSYDDTSIIVWKNEAGEDSGYFIIDLLKREQHRFPLNLPDGHPVVFVHGGRRLLLTDTYPNFFRFSNLYIVDLETYEFLLKEKFYNPLRFFGNKRVDLHPRVFGNEVIIDTCFGGKEAVLRFNIGGLNQSDKSPIL